MDDHPLDAGIETVQPPVNLDDAFKLVWDRLRTASSLIAELREQKHALSDQVAHLEREVTTLRSEVQSKDQDFKRLRMEHAQLLSANGSDGFSSGEKEILKEKVRDIIAKINSYL